MRAAQELFSIGIYSVHIRTRKFRNLAKTKRYVVPAPRANSKTQGGTRIDSDSICHRHHSVFRVFKRSEYTPAGGASPAARAGLPAGPLEKPLDGTERRSADTRRPNSGSRPRRQETAFQRHSG